MLTPLGSCQRPGRGAWQFDRLVGGYTGRSWAMAAPAAPSTLEPVAATWQSDDQSAEVPARLARDPYK